MGWIAGLLIALCLCLIAACAGETETQEPKPPDTDKTLMVWVSLADLSQRGGITPIRSVRATATRAASAAARS